MENDRAKGSCSSSVEEELNMEGVERPLVAGAFWADDDVG